MMGRKKHPHHAKSHTLPSSPTYSSSSSSDFEFTISLSPRKSSAALCPADELFYKGQLLPLHLSPRLSMVRTLLLASSSTSSSSDTTTTASRDSHSSTDSRSSTSSGLLLLHHHNLPDCDSSRPSSATDDEFKRLTNTTKKASKYFSFSKFSSVFRKEPKNPSPSTTTTPPPPPPSSSSVKRVSSSAKEVIRKYLKKVKPLYDKLSQKQQQIKIPTELEGSGKETSVDHENPRKVDTSVTISHSFSGNLRYPRRRNCIVSSCPSSMRSSPSHSGILSKNVFPDQHVNRTRDGMYGYSDSSSSSMEELQSAIQGAIAHCKNSMMIQNKSTLVSNEV